jgi:hypothetical protein
MNVGETISALSVAVSAVSAVISAGALIYAAKSVNASRRATQLQIFDGLFKDIKRLDSQYSTEFKCKCTQPTSQWCDDFFNTLEYLAFLLNHKMILREELHDFYKDAVLHWYRTFAENTSKKNLDNPDFFPEFKKLYRALKNDGMS